MSTFVENHIRIATYAPEGLLTNEDIEQMKILKPTGAGLLTAEGLKKLLGIDYRHIANGEGVLDMGVKAGLQAVTDKRGIDFIIASSSFPIGLSISAEIAERLYLSKIIPGSDKHTLDIHAACSGFVAGLVYLYQNKETMMGKTILDIATEKYSPHLVRLDNPDLREKDPSYSGTIFSDGAVATEMTLGKNLQIWAASSITLGHLNGLIQMPVRRDLMTYPYLEAETELSEDYFRQDGTGVFKAVSEEIVPWVNAWTREAGIDPHLVKRIIPHQGSGRMIDQLQARFAKTLHPSVRVVKDTEAGNWSSGSVPKALARDLREQVADPNEIIILLGFGAGKGLAASVAAVTIGENLQNQNLLLQAA